MQYIPRLPETNVNVTPTSPLKDLLVMLGGLAAIMVAVYVALGLAVDFLVPRISPEMEKRLSDYISPSRIGGDKILEGESTPLQGLADRIQDQCVDLPYRLQVELVDNEMVNALALPGGQILVFSGLLDAAASENELAFVLAHEMGHFVNRDHLTGLGRGLVFMAMSAALFGTDSTVGQRVGHFLQVSELGFSRKHESGADAYALKAVNCYYGHVSGSTAFFEHTGEMDETRFAGHYLSSHPLHAQRVNSLKKQASDLGFLMNGELRTIAPFKKSSGKLFTGKITDNDSISGND